MGMLGRFIDTEANRDRAYKMLYVAVYWAIGLDGMLICRCGDLLDLIQEDERAHRTARGHCNKLEATLKRFWDSSVVERFAQSPDRSFIYGLLGNLGVILDGRVREYTDAFLKAMREALLREGKVKAIADDDMHLQAIINHVVADFAVHNIDNACNEITAMQVRILVDGNKYLDIKESLLTLRPMAMRFHLREIKERINGHNYDVVYDDAKCKQALENLQDALVNDDILEECIHKATNLSISPLDKEKAKELLDG